jgi:hypothetical protein
MNFEEERRKQDAVSLNNIFRKCQREYYFDKDKEVKYTLEPKTFHIQSKSSNHYIAIFCVCIVTQKSFRALLFPGITFVFIVISTCNGKFL